MGGIGLAIALAAAAAQTGLMYDQNQQNLRSQKIQNARDAWMQVFSWYREDTAYQRAVSDLRAAGLSPTLAAGGQSPSSSYQSMTAPQSKMKYPDLGDTAAQYANTLLTTKQIQRTQAEKNWIDLQTEFMKNKAPLELMKINEQIKQIQASAFNANVSASTKNYNLYKAKDAGIRTTPSAPAGIVQDTVQMINRIKQELKGKPQNQN